MDIGQKNDTQKGVMIPKMILENSFPIPTNSFNAIYQLVHVFRLLMGRVHRTRRPDASLEEIMRSGNFGHDDTRFAKAKDGMLAHASLRLNSG